MQISTEFFVPHGDVDLCVQTLGSPDADPLLLIMGLSGTLNWWDDALCERLVEAGFFVIRYDNRDTGRSTKIDEQPRRTAVVGGFVSGMVGSPRPAPYTMDDLADDAVAILDALQISSAHLAGVSMGGMIAQTIALNHRDRVKSLTSIMSTTGKRSVGWQSPRLFPALLASRKPLREVYVANTVRWWRRIGSPGFPTPVEATISRAEQTWERGVDVAGVMRQMIAIVNQPDRTAGLQKLDLPTVVMHGNRDPMVHISGGRATAQAIPNAELIVIPGMGHDLPPALFDVIAQAISLAATRARAHATPQ